MSTGSIQKFQQKGRYLENEREIEEYERHYCRL